MNPERDPDETLRRAFGALRREDERTAPRFDDVARNAAARGPRARLSLFARAALASAPLAAAAAMALAWLARAPDEEPVPAPAPASAPASSAAASPALPPLELDFLLDMPASASLAALPDFDTDPLAQDRAP